MLGNAAGERYDDLGDGVEGRAGRFRVLLVPLRVLQVVLVTRVLVVLVVRVLVVRLSDDFGLRFWVLRLLLQYIGDAVGNDFRSHDGVCSAEITMWELYQGSGISIGSMSSIGFFLMRLFKKRSE